MRKNIKIPGFIEPGLFLLMTLVNLLPVLLVKYFLTVDGPAHLYNAKLMAELFSNPSGLLSKCFEIKNLVPTNLTDHYFFLLTGYFLPGFLSEKLLMLFYIAGLPYAFRYFIRSNSPDGIYLSWFIFPFTYSFLFFYGFFNFSIALVFLFISLAYLKKFYARPSVLSFIFFLILALLISLSHAFVFLIFLIYLLIFYHNDFFHLLSDHPEEMKNQAVGKLSLLFFAIIPSLVLIIISSVRSQHLGLPESNLDFYTHLKWIRQIQPAKGILYHREDIYTAWLFYLLVLLTIVTIYNMIFSATSYTKGRIMFTLNREKKNVPDLILLLVTAVILALYLILPDSFRDYSFISSRLLVFFFLFFITWIASGFLQVWIRIMTILVIVVMSSFLLSIYFNESKKLNNSACELEKAADLVPPNSVVLPIDRSGKWIYGHFSNYMGINKPLVILENYEAELNYFPVSWNNKKMPRFLFGETDSLSPCLSWKSQMANDPYAVDFVLLINNPDLKNDSCNTKISEILNRFYQPVFKSENNEIELHSLIDRK